MIAALAATLAPIGAAHATTTEFVINGNFSQLSNGLGELTQHTIATGWTTTGYNFVMNNAATGSTGHYGNLALWDAGNGGINAWDGMAPGNANFVAMDGDFSTGPLMQTIAGLKTGQAYKLTFDYAFSQQRGFTGDTVQYLTSDFGGSTVFTSPTYDLPSKGFSGWDSYSGILTANSTTEVLSFLAHGNVPVPPFALLTNVSLVAVPEPGTWAMMIVGLGAVGALARRRQRTIALA